MKNLILWKVKKKYDQESTGLTESQSRIEELGKSLLYKLYSTYFFGTALFVQTQFSMWPLVDIKS